MASLEQMGWQLVLALVVAYATVWLSVRRFRKEQRWTARAERFDEVLAVLHTLRATWAALVTALNQDLRGTASGRPDELAQQAFQQCQELRKAVARARIVVKAKSSNMLLRQLARRARRAESDVTFARSGKHEEGASRGAFQAISSLVRRFQKLEDKLVRAARLELGFEGAPICRRATTALGEAARRVWGRPAGWTRP